jgi:hypothetical protein
MHLLAILRIIELTLELAVELVKSLPPEQRAAFAERHEARMAFFQRLAERFEQD